MTRAHWAAWITGVLYTIGLFTTLAIFGEEIPLAIVLICMFWPIPVWAFCDLVGRFITIGEKDKLERMIEQEQEKAEIYKMRIKLEKLQLATRKAEDEFFQTTLP